MIAKIAIHCACLIIELHLPSDSINWSITEVSKLRHTGSIFCACALRIPPFTVVYISATFRLPLVPGLNILRIEPYFAPCFLKKERKELEFGQVV